MQTDGHTTYVVGDVHGHLDELLGALAGAGLIDDEANWTGGETHLWFLGDFVDRGPDGIGVIDLVMRLAKEAEKAGGQVETLLGNHEILLLGMHRFGDTDVPSDFGPRSFARSWEMNGGQLTDQEAITGEHVDWLCSRPALALVGDHLLMHSDTVEYLVWGATIDEINAGIQEVLRGQDIVQWWEVWRRLTTRHAFRGPYGGEVAIQLLDVLGGARVVHGHSVIADQLGVAPAQIEAPYEYANGLALGVDGGVFVGGPCLVVPLPYDTPPDEESGTAPWVDAEDEPEEPDIAPGKPGSAAEPDDTDTEGAERGTTAGPDPVPPADPDMAAGSVPDTTPRAEPDGDTDSDGDSGADSDSDTGNPDRDSDGDSDGDADGDSGGDSEAGGEERSTAE